MNWKILTKGISVLFILSVLSLGIMGDTWSGRSARADLGLECRVMPLGDSITVGKYSGTNTTSPAGDFDDIGYREDLYSQLTGTGYSVDFVGTNSNGVFADPDHEGHNGWTDTQIADNIYTGGGGENWLSQNPADVIFLHIGTNSPRNPSEAERILDEIDDYQVDTGSKVIVIIARIIGTVSDGSSAFSSYNDSVETLVTGRSDYGTELFLVDMEGIVGWNYSIYPGDPGGDMIDNLHPYATGYTKMAGVWFTKYNDVIGAAPANNAPVVISPGTQTDSEGQSVSVPISASDVDITDSITYTAYNLPPGLSINSSNGTISGTIDPLASNGSPYRVEIVVADGNICGSDHVSFTWNVSEVNFPPVLVQPDDQTDDEGNGVSLQIVANDPNGDNLNYVAEGLPGGLSIDQDGLISGMISYSAANVLPYNVTVTADDGEFNDSVTFNWTVNEKNGPPQISPISDQDDFEGTLIMPPLVIDAVDPDGDPVLFQASNLPPGLSIHAASGEITGTIAYQAVTSGSFKDYLVEIQARDDQDPPNTSSEFFNWRIRNVSGPPMVTNPGDQYSQVGDSVSLQIEASDPDGDSLSFAADNLPANLVIDAGSGEISGEIAEWAALNNPYSVTIRVTDDSLSSKSTEVHFYWILSQGEVYLPLVIQR